MRVATRALGDFDDASALETLLSEQLKGGPLQPLFATFFPAGHGLMLLRLQNVDQSSRRIHRFTGLGEMVVVEDLGPLILGVSAFKSRMLDRGVCENLRRP